jgi:hypothetical protein
MALSLLRRREAARRGERFYSGTVRRRAAARRRAIMRASLAEIGHVPALFRRRHVWLPTLWGAALVLAVLAAIAVSLIAAAPAFLAVTERARGPDGNGARVLIVEGWMDDRELDQAVALFRSGHYERIVTTGGPLESWIGVPVPWNDYAERGARYLAAHGLADATIDAVPAPASAQDRTFLSAVVVREWAARRRIRLDAFDLLSVGVHARRSRMMFRAAFGPEVEVGVIAAQPALHDTQRWWKTSVGAKVVLGESISLAWTACCFWPPAPGSREERWALPADKSP